MNEISLNSPSPQTHPCIYNGLEMVMDQAASAPDILVPDHLLEGDDDGVFESASFFAEGCSNSVSPPSVSYPAQDLARNSRRDVRELEKQGLQRQVVLLELWGPEVGGEMRRRMNDS